MHTVLFIVAWILGGAFVVYKVRQLPEQSFRLACLCTAYLVLLGIFGHIYQQLYLARHENFVFASDITQTRKNETKAEADAEKARKNQILQALKELDLEVDAGSARIDADHQRNAVFVATSNYRWSFLFDTVWSGQHDNALMLGGRIYLYDKSELLLASEPLSLNGPKLSDQSKLPPKQWDSLCDSYFPPDIRDRANREQILSAITAGAVKEFQIIQWNYTDFLYFSTITQTTVGYGDILPNSSAVRIVVMVQVLFGLFLLGVGVSLVTNPAGTGGPTGKTAR